MKYSFFLFIAFLICCTSPSDRNSTPSVNLVEHLESDLDSLFNSRIGENDPGATLLVAYEGEMLVGTGYGLRDVTSKEPVTVSTNLRMGSVSKQFTTLCILDLVDKGKISLKDTVYNIYPFKIFKNITIEHLINHTSGIADAEDILLAEWDPSSIAINKDIVECYSRNPPAVFDPGTQYKYNNGAYELLAAIVEKVSGQEFASYAREHIFQKAGMKDSHFFNLADPVEIKERASCHEKDSLGNWTKVDGHPLNGLLGAGGLYLSVNDYFNYDQALRNRSIVSEAMHDIIFKPSSVPLASSDRYKYKLLGSGPEHYAMGWFVRDNIALHTGSWLGTSTIVVHDLDRPLTLAIFMNSNSSIREGLIDAAYSLVDSYLKKK